MGSGVAYMMNKTTLVQKIVNKRFLAFVHNFSHHFSSTCTIEKVSIYKFTLFFKKSKRHFYKTFSNLSHIFLINRRLRIGRTEYVGNE